MPAAEPTEGAWLVAKGATHGPQFDVVWGPAIVEGAFGRRRIAFVSAPGDMRLEFMEQLAL